MTAIRKSRRSVRVAGAAGIAALVLLAAAGPLRAQRYSRISGHRAFNRYAGYRTSLVYDTYRGPHRPFSLYRSLHIGDLYQTPYIFGAIDKPYFYTGAPASPGYAYGAYGPFAYGYTSRSYRYGGPYGCGPYRSSYSYRFTVAHGAACGPSTCVYGPRLGGCGLYHPYASGYAGYGYGYPGYGSGYGYSGYGYSSYGYSGYGYSGRGYWAYPRALGYTFGRRLGVNRPYAADLTRYGPGFRGRIHASYAFVADGDRSWLAVDPGYGGYNVERYPAWRVAIEDALDRAANAPEEPEGLELPPGWKLEGADEESGSPTPDGAGAESRPQTSGEVDAGSGGRRIAGAELSALDRTLRAIREGRRPSGRRGYLRYPDGSVVGGKKGKGKAPSDGEGRVAQAGDKSRD